MPGRPTRQEPTSRISSRCLQDERDYFNQHGNDGILQRDQNSFKRTTFGGGQIGKIQYVPELKFKLTWTELDQKCKEIFHGEQKQRIAFKERGPLYQLDAQIKKILQETDSSIPIANLGEDFFVVGDKTMLLRKRGQQVLLQVGGGWETLKDYIKKN